MRQLKIAIATERHNHYYDTVISLMNECNRRGHNIFWYVFEETKARKREYYAKLYRPRFPVKYSKKGMIISSKPKLANLAGLDAVMLKRDPPVDEKVLDSIQGMGKKVLTVNDPRGIKRYLTKGYLKRFSEYTAPSHFSKSPARCEKIARKLGDCVVKEVVSHGGFGVYHVYEKNGKYFVQRKEDTKEVNLKKLFRKLTKNGKREVLIVEYLKNVGKGDKRIHVLEGKILGAIMRVPRKGGWIANIKSGGSVRKTKVTPREKEMARKAARIMGKHGIYLIGMDTLENDSGRRVISEINTTNVGALHIYEPLYGRKMTAKIIDWIEKKVRQRGSA